MTGLTLYTSNRLEVLADELAGVLRRPGDPLKPDIIIVQSRGMERWLSMALAQRNGIVANCQFPFPNAFIENIFGLLFDFDPHDNPYDPRVLTFRITGALPGLIKRHAAFDAFRTYLKDDARGVKGYQLASEISDLLDQYLLFRPQMLLDWEKNAPTQTGDPFPWQRLLWKQLTQLIRKSHRAALWQALVGTHPFQAASQAALPERVSLFGVSYLPPYYLQVLQALSGMMTIDIYQLNPCQEYWADIASDREAERMRRRAPDAHGMIGEDALHIDIGNRLLASMGGNGREFHALIAEFDGRVEERFQEVAPDNLLNAVQHDLLTLSDREGSASRATAGKALPVPCNSSIQVHACHGPMREIEVLYDQLLALLDTHPELEPRDILVMTPDIQTYAPYIQAVFGTPPDEGLALPFSIADRCLASASPLVEAFNHLLDLRTARFTRSEVLALLEFKPLRERFSLVEADLPLIDELTDRVRIRWSIDGAAKRDWHLPVDDTNTWRNGLDRLVMGYALHAEPDRRFAHLLPDDGFPGSQADLIGRLSDLVESLYAFGQDLDRPRTVTQWHARLTGALTEFFTRDAHFEYDFEVLERLLGEIQSSSVAAAFEDPVDLDIVRAGLNRRLSRENYRGGFIAGGITFGALLPMRSIPAAVICLIGMNHDGFPRLDRPRSFDRMALEPQLGDRSRRNDDRYLFLEALISARRCLYISYTGFDLHDNSVRPPSVLVSELIDYLKEGYGLNEDDLVTPHRLQAFSPAYFQGEDSRLFSYNRDCARAARNLVAPGKMQPDAVPFLACALEKWPPHFLSLTPEDLLKALGNPCRFLLERRVELLLRPEERTETDRETFELHGLERFQEGQWLTSRVLDGMPVEELQTLQQARGILPQGEAGQSIARGLFDDVAVFCDQIRPHADQTSMIARSFQIQLDGFQFNGRLTGLTPQGPVLYRFSRANANALLSAWIQHLVYCHLAAAEQDTGSTVLICRDEVRRFNFLPNSLALLEPLLDLYFQAAHVPLAIFPRTTLAFARQHHEKGMSEGQAFKAARRAWEGHFKLAGESEDPYIALAFRGRDPLMDPDFEELAAQLYLPLLTHSEIID